MNSSAILPHILQLFTIEILFFLGNIDFLKILLFQFSDEQFVLTEEQSKQFEKFCECRISRMPVQYIIGEWDFCDLKLKIVPPVFIPRPETEELVQLILQQTDDKLTMRFLEVGCGTGNISLALLRALPKVR